MNKNINKNILACPDCRQEGLDFSGSEITCRSCGSRFYTNNGKYYFTDKTEDSLEDPLDRIKYRLKHFNKIYNLLVWIISPVFVFREWKKFTRESPESNYDIILNLGSGSSRLSDKHINIDMFDYREVDIVCDIARLPVADNSVDSVICLAVLEHVPVPVVVVDEMYRVLKHGGRALCYMPFIVGFHASPHDYSRLTHEGLKKLFSDFTVEEIKVGGGPTSGLLWVLQEWIATLLSFGSSMIHRTVYIIVMLATFPLKFLDILLMHYPDGKNIASGFYIIAKKDKKSE